MDDGEFYPVWTVIARVERTITDDVVLHLIRDETRVELHDGDEFVTVQLQIDPWASSQQSPGGDRS